MPNVLNSIDGRLLNNSYNVLQTFWELPRAPKAWRWILSSVNEIWAPNKFVADAFRSVFSGPITVIPPVVHVGEGPFPSRHHFGLDANRFYFMFSFDYFSSPIGRIRLVQLRHFTAHFQKEQKTLG